MSEIIGSAPAGNPPPAGEWYAGIADEGVRGFAQTKGWKYVGAVVDGYRNLEKLVGLPQERLARIPERSDDEQGWGQLYGRLGRPEKPDGYELKFEGDDAFAKSAAETMHKLGVSKGQAQGLNEFWNGHVAKLIADDKAAREQADAADITTLKSTWGADYDKHVEQGRRAGREFGLSEQEFAQVQASLGTKKTLELFQKIGAKLGEASPFNPQGGNGGNGFGMTREGAQARIKSLMDDKDWTAKYLNGGAAEREEMGRLQQIASGSA